MCISRPFHIVTALKSNRYLDVISNRAAIKTPNGRDSQLWVFDYKTRTIKSKANNYSLDMRSTSSVYAYATNSQWYQIWKYKDNRFVNQQGRVLDAGKSDSEGANVLTSTKNDNEVSQKWNIRYADKVTIKTNGTNEERDMDIGKPFFIVSRMWMNRVMTVEGGKNVVIRSRNGKKEQQWVFDNVSKTIKSVSNNDLSLDVRSTSAYAKTTDSRWY